MEAGDLVKPVNETLEALVLKFKLPVTEALFTVALALSAAAPVVVKVKGLIATMATPLLSVNAVALAALPARVAMVKSVENVTNWLAIPAPLALVITALA
ncbi:hypothetical protein RD110_20675 [Rhodoferax koreense]|uniref:Uncharacterized protein n=2 Tax=Rhodoferax koreensis TaxID=1842727 RepID=A0A1P8K012_9BURK|nr:hypothetical protein RD110_20675 [Rhodoferax koreense]